MSEGVDMNPKRDMNQKRDEGATMTEVLQLTDVSCRVVEMTETLTDVTVKFERTEWTLVRGEGDDATFEMVGSDMPGALWSTNGEFFSLRFPEADGLWVGGHYQLRLEEVPNASPDNER